MRHCRGFTLLELMITIFIGSIILAKGIPSFVEYLNNSKVRRVANEMYAGMMQAKAEAIRNNSATIFTPAGTGWRVDLIGVGGDGNALLVERPSEGSENKISVTQTAASIAFRSSGRTTLAASFQMNVSLPSAGSCQANGGKVRCLRITVTPAGTIKQCDPVLPASDARAC